MKFTKSCIKWKSLVLAGIFFLVFGHSISAQIPTNKCFEIKYFDFFGLDERQKINWPDTELDSLLKTDFQKDGIKTSFLIPWIVFQLKDFHPRCNYKSDLERLKKLLNLYFRIRDQNFGSIQGKSIAEQLDFVRDDFYSQVLDDSLLVHMTYSMDDGPLKGEIPKRVPNFSNGKHIRTDFGRLTIFKNAGRIYLTAADHKKRVIWARIMTGVAPKRYFTDLEFNETAIEKTSLATRVHLHTSERLTLYLKNDGRFMYYFHSW